MLRFAGFQIDPQRAELRRSDGEVIKLRPKPFDMLAFFATQSGRVVSKRELMERFWPGVHVGEDSLFQCIREIRAALGDSQRLIIRNISGRGYLFEAEVVASQAEMAAPQLDKGADPTEETIAAPQPEATIAPVPVETMLDMIPPRNSHKHFGWIAAALGAGVAAVLAIALLVTPPFGTAPVSRHVRPAVMVMPFAPTQGDAQTRATATGVAARLTAGLAKIENLRVVTTEQMTARASLEPSSGRTHAADYIVSGEVQKEGNSWLLRGRMTRASSGEIVWASDLDVAGGDVDSETQQSRLAAAMGHPLALRLNAIFNDAVPGVRGTSGSAKVAVEQATASIVQTSRERFHVAQAMLEKALADYPDDVDVQAALAALQMRGIQMVWYGADERESVRAQAQALLERVLKVKPTYLPVLESYCRLLSATNRFAESLVACARALSFDPWNGLALYHVGLNQIFLGRFEDALTNFRLADQYDTPTVSRWTWLLGNGLALVYLERYGEAVPWLERSLAVTPGTGRTHFILAAAYHRLGRVHDAQAAMAKGMELRPGTTADTVTPPTQNTSPVFLAASARTLGFMVEAGLPQR